MRYISVLFIVGFAVLFTDHGMGEDGNPYGWGKSMYGPVAPLDATSMQRDAILRDQANTLQRTYLDHAISVAHGGPIIVGKPGGPSYTMYPTSRGYVRMEPAEYQRMVEKESKLKEIQEKLAQKRHEIEMRQIDAQGQRSLQQLEAYVPPWERSPDDLESRGLLASDLQTDEDKYHKIGVIIRVEPEVSDATLILQGVTMNVAPRSEYKFGYSVPVGAKVPLYYNVRLVVRRPDPAQPGMFKRYSSAVKTSKPLTPGNPSTGWDVINFSIRDFN